MFVTYKWNDINLDTLRKAIGATFEHRNSVKYLEDYKKIIENLSQDDTLDARWDKYRKEHEYAKEIEFGDTIEAIKKICDEVW